MERWEFTWKSVGYGACRQDALNDAKAHLDEAEPCDEELLESEEGVDE
jgi:hypothetical protein